MEKKLLQLFDFQRFQLNPKLQSVLQDVESRYAGVLSEEDLEMVSAAGTADASEPELPWNEIQEIDNALERLDGGKT